MYDWRLQFIQLGNPWLHPYIPDMLTGSYISYIIQYPHDWWCAQGGIYVLKRDCILIPKVFELSFCQDIWNALCFEECDDGSMLDLKPQKNVVISNDMFKWFYWGKLRLDHPDALTRVYNVHIQGNNV